MPGISLQIGGTAAAPSAGAAVVTLAAPPQGVYTVWVSAGLGLGGAPAAGDNANMQLKAGATVIAILPIVAAQNVVRRFGPFTVNLDGATALTVNAIGNATAATVYVALIVATPLSHG